MEYMVYNRYIGQLGERGNMPDYRSLKVERDIAAQLLQVTAKATIEAKRRVTLSQVMREALALYEQKHDSNRD